MKNDPRLNNSIVIQTSRDTLPKVIQMDELSKATLNEIMLKAESSKVYGPNITASKLAKMQAALSQEIKELASKDYPNNMAKANAFSAICGFNSMENGYVIKLLQHVAELPANAAINMDTIMDYFKSMHDDVTYQNVYMEYHTSDIGKRLNFQVGGIGVIKFLRFAQFLFVSLN